MSKITATELNLLRSRPHETTLWLSIYKPSTILACQVNDVSAAPGLRLITYDNVTGGSYTRVQSGMVMSFDILPSPLHIQRFSVK